jgi:hypothetical protein
MKLSEIQQEFTYHIACLIHHAYDVHGIRMSVGEAHRTNDQMLLNYYGYKVEKSLSGGSLYLVKRKPTSKVKWSSHGDRLAMDFNFFIEGKLTYEYEIIKPLGDYWVSLHPDNVWGGDFNKNEIEDGFVDTPHFQRRKK